MAITCRSDLYLRICQSLDDKECSDFRSYVKNRDLVPARDLQHLSPNEILLKLEHKRMLKTGDLLLLEDLLKKIGREDLVEAAMQIAAKERKVTRLDGDSEDKSTDSFDGEVPGPPTKRPKPSRFNANAEEPPLLPVVTEILAQVRPSVKTPAQLLKYANAAETLVTVDITDHETLLNQVKPKIKTVKDLIKTEKAIQKLSKIKGVNFNHEVIGSLVFYLQCTHLGGLGELWFMCKSGELDSLLYSSLISEETFKQLCAESISVKATIDVNDFRKTLVYLLTASNTKGQWKQRQCHEYPQYQPRTGTRITVLQVLHLDDKNLPALYWEQHGLKSPKFVHEEGRVDEAIAQPIPVQEEDRVDETMAQPMPVQEQGRVDGAMAKLSIADQVNLHYVVVTAEGHTLDACRVDVLGSDTLETSVQKSLEQTGLRTDDLVIQEPDMVEGFRLKWTSPTRLVKGTQLVLRLKDCPPPLAVEQGSTLLLSPGLPVPALPPSTTVSSSVGRVGSGSPPRRPIKLESSEERTKDLDLSGSTKSSLDNTSVVSEDAVWDVEKYAYAVQWLEQDKRDFGHITYFEEAARLSEHALPEERIAWNFQCGLAAYRLYLRRLQAKAPPQDVFDKCCKALTYFNDAIQVYEKHRPDNSRDAALCWVFIGIVILDTKESTRRDLLNKCHVAETTPKECFDTALGLSRTPYVVRRVGEQLGRPELKEYEKALEMLDEALQENPKHCGWFCHDRKGVIYFNMFKNNTSLQGQSPDSLLKESLENFKKAVELKGTHTDFAYIGQIHMELGDYSSAIAAFREAVNHGIDDRCDPSLTHRLWGTCLEQLDEFEGAEEQHFTAKVVEQTLIRSLPGQPVSGLSLKRQVEHPRNKQGFKFDFFVSYCSKDEEWVVGVLVKTLEEKYGFKGLVHDRDFQVGKSIIDNISYGIDQSFRTILVLSPEFLKSNWCRYEMEQVHLQARKDHLVVILYKPCDVPDEISHLTYLRCRADGQLGPSGWKRLEELLMIQSKDVFKVPLRQ